MIKGRDAKGVFYETFRIASETAESAENLAIETAKNSGIEQALIEETELHEANALPGTAPGVQEAFGKSYFPE